MTTTSTPRDAIQNQIDQMSYRFPELRSGRAQRSIATGEMLGRVVRALANRLRGGRPPITTVFVDNVRV